MPEVAGYSGISDGAPYTGAAPVVSSAGETVAGYTGITDSGGYTGTVPIAGASSSEGTPVSHGRIASALNDTEADQIDDRDSPGQSVRGYSGITDDSGYTTADVAPTPAGAETTVQGADVPAVAIRFGSHTREEDVTDYSRGVIEDILRNAGLSGALVSSTARTPAEQARVMYNNLEQYGAAAQRRLYNQPGRRVIDVYSAAKAAGEGADRIKMEMEGKIRAVGATNVSRHASDPRVLDVFDIAPSSIADRRAFERAVRADPRVQKFLLPPQDPGYHLEIPQR